uniref:DIS3-like exonuclease 2 n=1 Tax=Anopheles christyi TaxID=43041 RepID=A0A182JQZ8_9DIPT
MSDEEFFREIRESIIDNTRKMLKNAGSSSGRKGLVNDSNTSISADQHQGEKTSKINGETQTGSLKGETSTANETKVESDPVKVQQVTSKREDLNTSSPITAQKTTVENNKTKEATCKEMKQDSGNGGGHTPSENVESADKKAMEVVTLQLEPCLERKQPPVVPNNATNSEAESDDDESSPPLGLPEKKDMITRDKKHKNEMKRKLKEASKQHESNKKKLSSHGAENDQLSQLTRQIQAIAGQIENLKKASRNDNVAVAGPSKHSSKEKPDKVKEKKQKAARSVSESIKNKEMKRKDKQQPIPSTSNIIKQEPSEVKDELAPDHKLLVQLFMLGSSQRKKFIQLQGIAHGLLIPHPHKKHIVLVNKKIQHLAESLVGEARQYIAESKEATVSAQPSKERKEPPVQASKPTSSSSIKPQRSSRGTYEEQVTFLLNDGKTCSEDDYDPRLILVEVRDRAKEIVQERLDSFVQGLVERNVGYVIEGLLRINARNSMQSFVDDSSRTGNVYIDSILLRRCAMEGDRVRVFVKHQVPSNDSDDSAEENGAEESSNSTQNNAGFVVAILEKRHNRQCVGKFLPAAPGKKHYRMFAPRDMRIPPIRVFKQDWPNALLDTKFVQLKDDKDAEENRKVPKTDGADVTDVLYQAEIIEWQDDVPTGTILKSIGKCGVLEVENESILVEHNLDVTPYGDNILAQLPAVPYTIPQEELGRREDLREECIFTIDPATARDLDDALSCKQLENGNYQIGVHISDVTYFLRESSPLDELVKLRATSIYMVDTVYHMLPKQLCNTCSLLPGEDKLAFSVFWEMQPDGTVLSTRFARTVINSCSQLSYEHAQLMLDNPDCEVEEDQFPEILHGYNAKKLCKIVNTLQSIAVKLRQRRMDDGCLKINQPKLTFRLDPATGLPTEYGVYKVRPSNEMIEDFMLLANTSVANAIYKAFPAISLLRAHSPPAENMMKNLVRTLSLHGHALSYASPKDIRECMETIIATSENPDATRSVLSVLLAKPMIRAQYYCSSFATTPEHFMHYALAIPMYTHFTSPIRRYADCLVHRVLAATLGIDEQPKRSPEEVQCLAMVCNEKKYNAKCAGETSSLLYFRHWLDAVGEYETDGAVMGYAAHFIELVLIHSGIVLKAATKKLASVATVVYKPAEPVGSCTLIPNDTSIPPLELTIFTKVRVTVKVVKDVITVCSILPIITQEQSCATVSQTVEQSVNDLSEDMKSARIY